MHLGEWAGIYCRKKWKHATRCYKMLQRLMLYHVVSQRRYTNLEPIQRQTKALVWLFTLRSCFECWCLTCLALGRGYWNLFCTASIWLCAIVVGTALKPNDSAEMIWIQLYNIVLRTAKLSKTVDCRHLWLLRSCLAQSFIRSIHSPFCIFHLQQGLIQLRLSCKCDSWVIEQNVQRSQDLGKYWGNSSIRTCKDWNFADFWTMTAEVNLIRKHQKQTSTKEAQSKWINNARLQF